MAAVKFPENSNNKVPEREARPHIAEGKTVKKSLGTRIVHAFIDEDVKSAPERIIFETVIPGIRNMIVDTITEAVTNIFNTGGTTRSSRSNYTSYSTIRPSSHIRTTHPSPRAPQPRKSFDNVVLPSREDAENVLDSMGDILSQYEVVTVADFYDLCSVTPDYVDDAWGWTDLRSASIRHRSDGYLIDLPSPKGIER